MPALAQRPTVVAGKSALGDQIQSLVVDSSGGPVERRRFEDCRPRLAWSRPGLLILVAADKGDCDPLAALAREAVLRRSPLTVVIVHAVDLDGSCAFDAAVPPAVARFHWPTAAVEFVAAVRAAPAATAGAQERELADRLSELTPSLVPMADRLAHAATHDLCVLLTGETGTGKTYLAKLLHDYSPRRHHPFLMVPCGAQSATLFESCFFGHVRGAFTGAHQSQKGKFAAAGKGTILLDEIDTLGMEQQASLLRVIETGEFEQVGGHVTLHSEARIIAASNWDLEAAVEDGRLRQDLYYRINVLSFRLPPLRERPQDIGPLARAFASHFSIRFKRPLIDIAPEAMEALEAYHWPGNIRQLEHTIQAAVLANPDGGLELRARDLPESVRQQQSMPASHFNGAPSPGRQRDGADSRANAHRPGGSLIQNRAEYERHLIRKALEECEFNRSSAARALGVSRVTLHKKIKQYGLADRS
jgi:transcriptional regulator with PAS, ATPase and Fis domain